MAGTKGITYDIRKTSDSIDVFSFSDKLLYFIELTRLKDTAYIHIGIQDIDVRVYINTDLFEKLFSELKDINDGKYISDRLISVLTNTIDFMTYLYSTIHKQNRKEE